MHGPITTEICGIPSADTGYHSVVSLILLGFNLVLEGRKEGIGRGTSSLVVKDTAKVVTVWEYVCLVGEVCTARVDEVYTR